VVLIEKANQVLSAMDQEMTTRVTAELTKNGIEVILGDQITEAQSKSVKDSVKIKLGSGRTFDTDMVIVGPPSVEFSIAITIIIAFCYRHWCCP